MIYNTIPQTNRHQIYVRLDAEYTGIPDRIQS